MYIKKCTICGKEFKTDHRKTKTCSKSCASTLRYKRNAVQREQAFANRMSLLHPDVEYISGFKTSNNHFNYRILLMCKQTGIKFYAYVSAIRKKNWHCSVCSHSASMCVINSDKKKYDSLMNKHSTIDIYMPCRWCGNVFLTHSMRRCYCSTECKKAKKNHDDSERKSKRYKQARANGKYETISLQRLYIRDKGKCYLCGKHLTLTEDYNRSDAPTIEHVIPICKGGTNTWKNVKLACRNCNVEKGIKILEA